MTTRELRAFRKKQKRLGRFAKSTAIPIGESAVDESVQFEFWLKTKRLSRDKCWKWLGGGTGKGYGLFVIHRGNFIVSSRLSWEIHNGKIPDGLFVLHKCDNRICVNPNHLFIGTTLDNTLDSIAKGSHYFSKCKGELNSASKLKKSDVIEMRNKFRNRTATCYEIAEEKNIFKSTAVKAIRGISWKHVPGAVTIKEVPRFLKSNRRMQ